MAQPVTPVFYSPTLFTSDLVLFALFPSRLFACGSPLQLQAHILLIQPPQGPMVLAEVLVWALIVSAWLRDCGQGGVTSSWPDLGQPGVRRLGQPYPMKQTESRARCLPNKKIQSECSKRKERQRKQQPLSTAVISIHPSILENQVVQVR